MLKMVAEKDMNQSSSHAAKRKMGSNEWQALSTRQKVLFNVTKLDSKNVTVIDLTDWRIR